MFKSFGLPEILLILLVVLIIFGAGKLPQVGGAIGKSIREFRKASKGEDEAKTEAKSETETKSETKAEAVKTKEQVK
jgi:sec-independent protein translocase protein TatA